MPTRRESLGIVIGSGRTENQNATFPLIPRSGHRRAAIAGEVKVWSPLAEQVVSRLIADLSEDLPEEARGHAGRLMALPIGTSLWAEYFLRANGEVVVVGGDLDHPEVDTV